MYLLSVLAIVLCFTLVEITQQTMGLFEFWDSMSLIFLLVLTIPVMLSAGLLKDLNNAFRLIFGRKKEAALLEIKRAKLAVDTMIRTVIYSSVFVMMLEIVVLLHNMTEPSRLGPIISVTLLTFLYAMIVSILLLPIGAKLEQRILEYMPSCEEGEEIEKQEEQKEQKEQKEQGTESLQ